MGTCQDRGGRVEGRAVSLAQVRRADGIYNYGCLACFIVTADASTTRNPVHDYLCACVRRACLAQLLDPLDIFCDVVSELSGAKRCLRVRV